MPLFAVCLAAACADAAVDPGPFDIDGWIGQCEVACHQLKECDPDQLLWDHGDLDNCIYDCTYHLERDANAQFVEDTPAVCLEALYAQLKCVVHLGCDDLDAWEDAAAGAPCAEETAAPADECAGVDAEEFMFYCGLPQAPATDI